MYKKILVPLDGSELASAVLPHVREVARCTHATVVLFRAVPEPGLGVDGLDGLAAEMLDRQEAFRDSDVPPSAAERAEGDESLTASRYIAPDVVEREIRAYWFLDAIASDLEQSGIHARTRAVIATPAEAILNVAAEEGVDLITMSTHGRGGLGRFLLGSVADRVVHHSNAPVLLVRSRGVADGAPEEVGAYKRLLVSLDGSALASTVLPYVREMALCTGAEVTLLQAVPEPVMEVDAAELLLALGDGAPTAGMLGAHEPGAVAASRSRRQLSTRTSSDLAKAVERETEAAQSNLNAAATALTAAGVRVETVVQVGHPAEVILDAARPGGMANSSGANMIAMATHGRSGIRRFLMGSVADCVVRHADVPVLLVRSHSET